MLRHPLFSRIRNRSLPSQHIFHPGDKCIACCVDEFRELIRQREHSCKRQAQWLWWWWRQRWKSRGIEWWVTTAATACAATAAATAAAATAATAATAIATAIATATATNNIAAIITTYAVRIVNILLQHHTVLT